MSDSNNKIENWIDYGNIVTHLKFIRDQEQKLFIFFTTGIKSEEEPIFQTREEYLRSCYIK